MTINVPSFGTWMITNYPTLIAKLMVMYWNKSKVTFGI